MQRILSVETSRNANTTTEFVSKRLCFSLLFSIAFMFLLAGYLLGRYTTDRALILKKAYIQQLLMEEKNSADVVKTIALSMKSINNITAHFQPGSLNLDELYGLLRCGNKPTPTFPTLTHLEGNFSATTGAMLTAHLQEISGCFDGVETYLRNVTSVSN